MQTENSSHGQATTRASGDVRSSGGVRRVLIAYDGSAGATEAIDNLARAGLPGQLTALIVVVHDNSSFGRLGGLRHAPRLDHGAVAHATESAGRLLAEAAFCRLRTFFPHWHVDIAVVTDTPLGGILRKAAIWQPDLLVVGAHGHSACERMLLGSVSRRIAITAWCPVRIARRIRPSPGRDLRVLLAVDGTADDEVVVQAVLARVWPPGTEIQILMVVDGHLSAATGSAESYAAAWKRQHDRVADAHACQVVDRLRNRLCAAGMSVETLIIEGDFGRCVVEYAAVWEADCIFVGETPSSLGATAPLDSITFYIAACAACTVEIARNQTPCVE